MPARSFLTVGVIWRNNTVSISPGWLIMPAPPGCPHICFVKHMWGDCYATWMGSEETLLRYFGFPDAYGKTFQKRSGWLRLLTGHRWLALDHPWRQREITACSKPFWRVQIDILDHRQWEQMWYKNMRVSSDMLDVIGIAQRARRNKTKVWKSTVASSYCSSKMLREYTWDLLIPSNQVVSNIKIFR